MFLAVLARHVDRSRQLAPPDRRLLTVRSRGVLAVIPPEVLQKVYATVSEDRRRLLAPLVLGPAAALGGGLRRRIRRAPTRPGQPGRPGAP